MSEQTWRPSGMRGFVVMWVGQFVSLLGSGMTRFAIALWAWEMTGSATALALITFFAFAPQIFLGSVAGALVDRWNRKLVMILSDTMAGVATIALFFLAWTGNLQLWHLYAAATFASVFEAFQFPAFSAAITVMVDKSQYSRTSAMLGLANSVSTIIAPISAAALYAVIGLQGIMAIDIVTFLFATLTLLLIVVPPVKHTEAGEGSRSNLWQESLFGFKYIIERKSLLAVQMVFFFGNLIFGAVIVLIPAMILARTGNDEILLATVNALMGIGGVVGGILMSTWGGFPRKVYGVLIAFLIAAVPGAVVLGMGQSLLLWGIGGFCFSFSLPMMNASNQAIWQAKIPPDIQGKVFGARRIFAQLAFPASMLIGGVLSDNVFEPAMMPDGALAGMFGDLVGVGAGAGMGLLFVLMGCAMVVVVAIAFTVPFIRDVEMIVPDFDEVAESGGVTVAPA
ncbi:MAG: MFS transporter [Chloroflexota bacterium]